MADRQPHYLSAVQGNRSPSQVAVVVAEGQQLVDCRWHARFGRKENGDWTRQAERRGNSPEEFWSWLWAQGQPGRRTWVFAPRWGRLADPLDLCEETTFGRGQPGKQVVSPGCCLIELNHKGRSLTLLDVRNWWDELPQWLDQAQDQELCTEDRLAAVCERLWSLVTRTIDLALEHDLGVIQPTLGAWASNVWRHWHSGQRLATHADIDALLLERRAYFGGQVIVHRRGLLPGPWIGVDCNMMYPWAMSSCLFPYSFVAYNPQADLRLLEMLPAHQAAIADVEVETSDWTYPVRWRRALVAARGTFQTSLAWPELSYALSQGHVKKVFAAAIYSVADLFGEWARRLWALRLQAIAAGQEDWAGLLKRLGVALHGKLSQVGAEWVEADFPCVKPWSWWPSMQPDGSIRRRRALGLTVQERWQADEEPPDACPSIGAWTTSAARQRMNMLRQLVGRTNWVYQYSDQLIINEYGLERMRAAGEMCPETLGRFKEDFRASQVEIRGPGWIMHDSRRRAAGIGQAATEVEPDTYTIEGEQSLAGKIGRTGPKLYSAWKRRVHFPPRETIGDVADDGWIDPLTL